jgi:hypothetical protein
MPYPNFLIIGAMKSGTTALYYFLKQHPQIFVSSVKEPNFFALVDNHKSVFLEGEETNIVDLESYLALFESVKNEIAIGEASHSYLYYPTAAENIRDYIPDIKLICVLRDPVERAYSHFLFHLRNGHEPTKIFSQAIEQEERRIRDNIQFGHYVHRGFYFRQLKCYFDLFDQSQIRVYLFDDLKNDPVALSKDVYQFLGVDSLYVPEVSIRRNPSGIPKLNFIHNLLVRPNRLKSLIQPRLPVWLYRLATGVRDRNLVKPELSPELRSNLIQMFRDDILKLENLFQRDLSNWLR